MIDIFWGAFIPFLAVRLLVSRFRLLILSLLPMGVTGAIYIFLYRLVLVDLRDWVASLASPIKTWLANVHFLSLGIPIISWSLDVMLMLLFLLFMALSFAWISNLAALPFNDFLSEAAEQFVSPPLSSVHPGGWKKWLASVAIDAKKSVFAIIIMLACLVLSLVPVINIAAVGVGWFMLAFQYVSYPQTRRHIGLWMGLRQLALRAPAAVGFGAMCSLMLSIPIVAICIPPLAVIGGTMLFARLPHCDPPPLQDWRQKLGKLNP